MVIYISGSEVDGQTSHELFSYIETQKSDAFPVHFLTFTFGTQDSHEGFARKLACKNKGLWTRIVDSGMPNMDNYFSFIALAAEHAPVQPNGAHFSQVYKDAGFLGDVMTTSKAFYQEIQCKIGPKRRLKGVAGIDTQVQQSNFDGLKALNGTKNDLSTRNVENLECQLQVNKLCTCDLQYCTNMCEYMYALQIWHLLVCRRSYVRELKHSAQDAQQAMWTLYIVVMNIMLSISKCKWFMMKRKRSVRKREEH